MSRLTNDKYKKPPITFTETLSKDEIKKLLDDYEQVNDVDTVKKETHLRYFTLNNDGTYKFRLGGKLMINNILSKYVVLSNNIKTWSVQKQNTIFFQKKI
jgi:hypothetical protein